MILLLLPAVLLIAAGFIGSAIHMRLTHRNKLLPGFVADGGGRQADGVYAGQNAAANTCCGAIR